MGFSFSMTTRGCVCCGHDGNIDKQCFMVIKFLLYFFVNSRCVPLIHSNINADVTE